MKLIVWLWNPWKEYENTRHNAWFLFIDWLKNDLNLVWEFKNDSKFKWEILETIINWEKTFLLKPQTFMNLSWESILKIMSFYKIEKKDIIIIFDDISLEVGKIRFRENWSSWWQNWVKSIISNIWDDFKRIKIWIWYDKKFELSNWVLSNFNENELKQLYNDFFPEARDLLFKNL